MPDVSAMHIKQLRTMIRTAKTLPHVMRNVHILDAILLKCLCPSHQIAFGLAPVLSGLPKKKLDKGPFCLKAHSSQAVHELPHAKAC